MASPRVPRGARPRAPWAGPCSVWSRALAPRTPHADLDAQQTKRLWIANSYFVPDEALAELIAGKARQGVDVRVLAPGPVHDVPPVRAGQRASYEGVVPPRSGGGRGARGRGALRRVAVAGRPSYWDLMDKVNLREKLALVTDHWHPRIVAELNGQHVKVVKLSGPFVWHQHEHEDELFLVLRGALRMELRDRSLELGEGELVVVPRGVEHRPVAEREVEVLLFEPAGTLNTGNVRDERTVEAPERI